MRIAKQYSQEELDCAKKFVKEKGQWLVYLMGRQKRTVFAHEYEELDFRIKELKNRIKNARLITFGF